MGRSPTLEGSLTMTDDKRTAYQELREMGRCQTMSAREALKMACPELDAFAELPVYPYRMGVDHAAALDRHIMHTFSGSRGR